MNVTMQIVLLHQKSCRSSREQDSEAVWNNSLHKTARGRK